MKSIFLLSLLILFSYNCSISNAFGRSSDSLGRSSDSMGRSSDSTSNSSKSSADYMGRSSDVMSNSSRGFSMSIVYSFMSSSGDKNKEKKTTYRMDVKGITELYSINLITDAGFIRDIAYVAEKNGITNWKNENLTYFAIGEGLKKANLTQSEFNKIKPVFSENNPKINDLLQKGFEFGQNNLKKVDLDS